MNGTDERRGRHAGVDWSWETHAVCVVDDDGQVIERFTVAHSAAGLAQLTGRLRRLGAAAVAIERGDGPVVQALLGADLQVFVITSRQVKARCDCATAPPATRTTDSMPMCSPTCCAPTSDDWRR